MIQIEQIKKVAFAPESDFIPGTAPISNAYIFEIGRYSVEFQEVREEFQLIDGEHDDQLRWIELTFELDLGYLGSLVNNGSSYVIPIPEGDITVNPKANTSWVDIANMVLADDPPIYFYPILHTAGNNYNIGTYYRVKSDNNRSTLINARNAGIYQPATPFKMKVKQPLTEYPSWISNPV